MGIQHRILQQLVGNGDLAVERPGRGRVPTPYRETGGGNLLRGMRRTATFLRRMERLAARGERLALFPPDRVPPWVGLRRRWTHGLDGATPGLQH